MRFIWHRVRPLVIVATLLAVIAACYVPGLSGGYVFDDEVNILQNRQLHVQSLSVSELKAAALSGNAGPMGRPISLLSFALNLYSSGTDPYFFKLANLLIHLGNTLVIGLLATVLLRALASKGLSKVERPSPWAGWIVAALWGLHPLNLTSVLYVVQRMTSLSALFGLLALLIYAKLRDRHVAGSQVAPLRTMLCGAMVLVLLGASALSKESGLLFVPLLLWIEYLIFGFRIGRAPIMIGARSLRTLTTATLAVAAIGIVFLVLPRMLGPGAYANRDFSLEERAFTEARVVMYYLRLLLLPRSSELSLYHDDIEISYGLLDPPSTALSIAALLIISAGAICWRKTFPLALFGWGWFLIAHSLESTIFPLELAHEHRNYFASIGLLMAVPPALARIKASWQRLAVGLLAAYLVLLGFVTFTRAQQWSSPVDLALLEASNHPHSARANYELGRTYLALLENTGEARFGPLAEQALRAASESYRPGLAPYFGLIHAAYYRGVEPAPEVVSKLKDGLRSLPFYNGNLSFLQAFLVCQVEQRCKMPDQDATSIFASALENPRIPRRTKAEVFKQLAQYHINRFESIDDGIDYIRKAATTDEQASTHIMLAQAYGMRGDFGEAFGELDRAAVLDRPGIYGRLIERERTALEAAERSK